MSRRADLLACAGLYLVATAWMGSALLGEAAITPEAELDADSLYRIGPPPRRTTWNDQTPMLLDWPRDSTFARGLAAGRIDLWNPAVACGAPLWAEQGGPFFPLKAPLYLSVNRLGYTWFLFLRVVAGAIGAYVLARARGLSPLAAFTAGAMFELSGVMLAQAAFGTAAGMALLPWALLGAHLLARGAGPLVPALTLGIIGHSGHPMVILLVYFTFGFALMGHAIALRREPRRVLRVGLNAAASAVLGLALAAPVLLPLLELRNQATSYKDINGGISAWELALHRTRSMTPIGLYAPGLIDFLRHESRALFPFPGASTLGVGALMLALTGVLLGVLDAGLLATLVAGLILTLAPPPFDSLIPRVPGLRLIYPWYCWGLFAVPMTQAAAQAAGLLGSDRARRRLLLLLLTIPIGVALVYWVPNPGREKIALQAMVRKILASPSGLVWAFLPTVGFVLVALAVLFRRSLRDRAGPILAAAALIELAVVMSRYHHEPRSRIIGSPASSAVGFLRATLGRDRFHALSMRVGNPNTPMLFRLRDLREISPLPIRRYIDYLHTIRVPKVFFTEHTAIAPSSHLFDQAAVREIVVERTAGNEKIFADRKPVYEDPRLRIYPNPTVRPRARIAPDVVAARSEVEARLLLPGIGSDLVILEPAGDVPPERRQAIGTATIMDERDPDRVVIDATLDRPGYLVLADTYYPGWTAEVDGAPVPIHPASLLFRAVPVPPGTHQVVFAYRPASFRNGLIVGSGALLVCAGLWLAGRLRRRQP